MNLFIRLSRPNLTGTKTTNFLLLKKNTPLSSVNLLQLYPIVRQLKKIQIKSYALQTVKLVIIFTKILNNFLKLGLV